MPFSPAQQEKVKDSILFFCAIIGAKNPEDLQQIQLILQEIIDATFPVPLLPLEILENSPDNVPNILQGKLDSFEKYHAYEILESAATLKKYLDSFIYLSSFTGNNDQAQKTKRAIESFIKSTLQDVIEEMEDMKTAPFMVGEYNSQYHHAIHNLKWKEGERGKSPVMQAIADEYETTVSPEIITKIYELTHRKPIAMTEDELINFFMNPAVKQVLKEHIHANQQPVFNTSLLFILSLGLDRALEFMQLLNKEGSLAKLTNQLNLHDLKNFSDLQIGPLFENVVSILQNPVNRSLLQENIISPELLLYLVDKLGLEQTKALFQIITSEPLYGLIKAGDLDITQLAARLSINNFIDVILIWKNNKEGIEFLIKNKLATSSDFNSSLNLDKAINIALSNPTIQFLLKNKVMELAYFCASNDETTPGDFKRIVKVGEQLRQLPQKLIDELIQNKYCKDMIFWQASDNLYENNCFLFALSQPQIIEKMLLAIQQDSQIPHGTDPAHDETVTKKIRQLLIREADVLLQEKLEKELLTDSDMKTLINESILNTAILLDLKKRTPDAKLFNYFKKLNALMNFSNLLHVHMQNNIDTPYKISEQCLRILLPSIEKVKLPLDLSNESVRKIIFEGIRAQMMRLLNLSENEFKNTTIPPLLNFLSTHTTSSGANSSQTIAETTHQTLINLARAYPINTEDFATYEEIDDSDAVHLSTGHKFDINSLVAYHNTRGVKYEWNENPDTDSKWIINPYNRQKIGFRDVILLVEFAKSKGLKFEQLNPQALSGTNRVADDLGSDIYAEVKWYKRGDFWDSSGRNSLTFLSQHDSIVKEINIKPKKDYSFVMKIKADKEFEQALAQYSLHPDSIKKTSGLRFRKDAKIDYVYTFHFDMSKDNNNTKKYEALLTAINKKTPQFRNISIIHDELRQITSSHVWALK